MTTGPFSPNPIPPVQNDIIQSQKSQASQSAQQAQLMQVVGEEKFQEWADQFATNVMAFARRSETLESKVRRKEKPETEETEQKEDENLIDIEAIGEVAEQFEKKNPEMKAKSLQTLYESIKEEDSAEEILQKVLNTYPDPTLADEALDFLARVAREEFAEKIRIAKEHLRKRFEREIKAGRNILEQSRQFSKEGLGSPEALRNMYREITGNPKDPLALFEELAAKHPFEKLKTIIAFLLHSLGSDLRSKGPSIEKGELYRLLTETRSLQAILGVFRYFLIKMNALKKAFRMNNLTMSPKLNFETLSRALVKYLGDRYPSGEKILLMSRDFGIAGDFLAQEIVYTSMLESLRNISPRMFRSFQHRQDVMTSFLEALDDIEEKLLEEEEEKEKKEREKGNK